MYTKTFSYAAELHQDQKVPGTDISYIFHLSLVTMEVIAALSFEEHENENLAVQCSLLHDTIEDTDAVYEDIYSEFGKGVADGVLALTKDISQEKSIRMVDCLNRIRKQPHEIWMVKLADRITNMSKPPEFWTEKKIINYHEEAVMIHDSLKDSSDYLSKRLLEKIKNYSKYI